MNSPETLGLTQGSTRCNKEKKWGEAGPSFGKNLADKGPQENLLQSAAWSCLSCHHQPHSNLPALRPACLPWHSFIQPLTSRCHRSGLDQVDTGATGTPQAQTLAILYDKL